MRAVVLAIAVLLSVAGGINAQNNTTVIVAVGTGSSQAAQTLTPQTANTLEPKIELTTQRVLQYQWNTTVAADPKSLTVRFDQQKQVDYTTTFTRTIQSDDLTLNGTITITNTNSFAVVIFGVRVQITPDRGGRPIFVEAQCQDTDNDRNTITFGSTSAKQVVCTFQAFPDQRSGRVQVQYALTRAGSYGYTAPGPVPYNFQGAPLVRADECALVFHNFTEGVPTPRDAPRLTAVQPSELREQRPNRLVVNNFNAAQICQTSRFTFVAVVGPFANNACGEKQLFYTAFAFPVSFRSQRSSSWDESDAYDIARVSTPVTVEGCRPVTQPATVRIESAVAQYVTVDSYRIARSISGLSSNRPTTVVVDYRRGGRLDVVTAVRRTAGSSIIQRRIVGNVVVASESGNPDYTGQLQVFVQQGRRISATVTCPGGGSEVTVRPGARVICRYEAVVTSESAAIVQAVFSPRNFRREQSPRVIVLNFRNAQRISVDPCYNVSETAQVVVVNPRSNPAPSLIVSGNRPPTRPTRVCTPTTYRYRYNIPQFRFNQCGRYQLILNARVAPISVVENVLIGTATQRQVINVDVVGCPAFTPVRFGISSAITRANIVQNLLSDVAERRD